MSSESIEVLSKRQADLRAALAQVGDFRPGSLAERYRACGKPSCHCAQPGSPGHGPTWSLTHAVKGKTVTRVIPAEAVERTREQIGEYRRFRTLVRQFVEVSERLCDLQLAGEKAARKEAEKKGASTPSSPRRSSRRSKPS